MFDLMEDDVIDYRYQMHLPGTFDICGDKASEWMKKKVNKLRNMNMTTMTYIIKITQNLCEGLGAKRQFSQAYSSVQFQCVK